MGQLRNFAGMLLLGATLSCFAQLSTPAAPNSAAKAQAQVFQKTIADVRVQISGWQKSANIQKSLVVIIGISGVLISAFHQLGKQWAKNTVLVLGIVTSLATVLSGSNAVFTADYRSLSQAAAQASRIVLRMDEIAEKTALLSNPTDIGAAIVEMNKQLDSFDAIATKVDPSGGPRSATPTQVGTIWPFQIPVVQAQSSSSAAPNWVKSPPFDGRHLYFVGIGYDVSLARAKDSSLTNAKNQIAQAFELYPPYVSTDARKKLIDSSTEVQDTFFTSSDSSQFTFYTLLRISSELQRMQPRPAEYDQRGWYPVDLTLDSTAGLFVLDHQGKILQITQDQSGIHLQQLFQLPGSYRPAVVAASQDSIFVSSNSQAGCNIFKYSISSKLTTQRNLGGGATGCDGIATFGTGLLVAFPGSQEIRYLPDWTGHDTRSFAAPESFRNCVLHYDVFGKRLLYAGPSGNAFALSLETGKWVKIIGNLGYVNSIAVTTDKLLFASGDKVLFVSRASNSGVNPPPVMESLGAKLISGVAVDSSNAAWITDYNKSSIRGPFELNWANTDKY